MHRRTRRTLLIVAGVVLLLAVAVFLRSKAPPEAARLLPESDGIIYINFSPFRAFFHQDLKPPERVRCIACPIPTAPTARWRIPSSWSASSLAHG
jgi:hypothetical protein